MFLFIFLLWPFIQDKEGQFSCDYCFSGHCSGEGAITCVPCGHFGGYLLSFPFPFSPLLPPYFPFSPHISQNKNNNKIKANNEKNFFNLKKREEKAREEARAKRRKINKEEANTFEVKQISPPFLHSVPLPTPSPTPFFPSTKNQIGEH